MENDDSFVTEENVSDNHMDSRDMTESSAERTSRKKWILPMIVAVVILALASVVVYLGFFKEKDDGAGALGYEDTAEVVTDEDELQKIVDGMLERTEDGKISLEYKNMATSSDGKNFICYIANSVKNKYDMYVGIYSDATCQEELLLTQLMKPGSGIKSFECEKKLEPGTYNTVLVFTLVSEDHETIKSQASVEYTLTVKDKK